MTLPVGTWSFNNGTGRTASLVINPLGATDGFGNQFFQGAMQFGTDPTSPITGFWNEDGQAIAFKHNALTGDGFRVFKGTLLSFPGVIVGFDIVKTYTLSGEQQSFSVSSTVTALASADTYLWTAEITVSHIIIL